MSEISEKEAAARALGLTYGQLVAREWMQQEACMPVGQAARPGRSRKARPDRPCEVCGSIMPHAHPRQKYCSDECRYRADYVRKRRLKGRVKSKL